MSKPFILSASISELALSDPAWAGVILADAQRAGLDLLLLGRVGHTPFDPQVIAAWAAPRITTMGVVPVVSARLALPFHVARALSAVDWLAGGMLGWNPVGEGHPAEQVADLTMATRALWDGWSDDTLILDKATGHYLDSSKVRIPNYVGPFYQTKGPVNAMRPRQGNPVLVIDADTPFDVPGADIVIAAQGQSAPQAARRLMRCGLEAEPAALSAAFAAGQIDGVHFDLTDAAAQIPVIAAKFAGLAGARPAGTLRDRLALPVPAAAIVEAL